MYYTITHEEGLTIVHVEENGKRLFIPTDPANTDYAAYLEWVADGNKAAEWNPDDETPSDT
jgi:hypothetical protein